jgi:hypothetical protein
MNISTFLLPGFLAGFALVGHAQSVIMSEDMGNPAAQTSIAAHVFQNSGLYTYSGNAVVDNTTNSVGYPGASGGGNVFFQNQIDYTLDITGINTTGFTDISLSFGAHKQLSTSDMSEFTVFYIVGSTGFVQLPIPLQPTGAGTGGWRRITLAAGSLPAVPNLGLRFRKNAGSGAIRLDDIVITGVSGGAPTVTATPASLAFGDVLVGTTSAPQVMVVSASGLVGAPGTLIVNNPPGSAYGLSLDNTNFSGSVQIPYTTSAIPSTPVYVRFAPTSEGPQNGNIAFVITGGGTAAPVPVTGNGVLASSVQEQADNRLRAWSRPGALVLEAELLDPMDVHVFDAGGRRAYISRRIAGGTQRYEIGTEDWPRGIYLMTVTSGTKRWSFTLPVMEAR